MYRVVKVSIIGRITETLYEDGNYEACRYFADRVAGDFIKIVVVDSKESWLYVAN